MSDKVKVPARIIYQLELQIKAAEKALRKKEQRLAQKENGK